MVEDIKKIVKDFEENTSDEGLYLIVKKEFIDGIRKWLDSYVHTIDGEWLCYSLKESLNETGIYILHLYAGW